GFSPPCRGSLSASTRSQSHLAEEAVTLVHDEARAFMREVELFHGFETGRRKMAEQALVVETRLGNDACCAWLIQPQIMAQTAQPAADILRAAPVFFPNQHVQAAVKRLPAIVTAN